MADEELVNYIEKHHKKGIHTDKIKSVLLEAGHDLEKVEEAILHIHYRNNLAKIIIVVAVLVLLIALILIQATKPKIKTVTEVIEPEALSTTAVTESETLPPAAETSAICAQYTAEQDRKACELEAEYNKKVTSEQNEFIWEAAYEEDASLCNDFSGYVKSACIDATTPDMSDAPLSLCEQLQTLYWKEICKGIYYYKEARRLNDPEYCKKVILPLGNWKNCLGEFE